MARYAAWMRPHYSPIFAVVRTQELANQLMLNWGVYPIVLPFTQQESEDRIVEAIRMLVAQRRLQTGDHLVIVSSIEAGEAQVDAIQMRTIP